MKIFIFIVITIISLKADLDSDGLISFNSGDKERNFKLWKKACNKGDAEGCSNLGVMYENGETVNQNNEIAASLYKKACDKGDAEGCYSLGIMYENGKGVSKNKETAVSLYKKACSRGNAGGCSSLEYIYGDIEE